MIFGFSLDIQLLANILLVGLVKEISQNDRVQDKLRAALWAAYGSARDESRQPSATEILATPVPYLDAVIEESLRMHSPVGVQIREAIVDTEVLGHKITKGTNVFSEQHITFFCHFLPIYPLPPLSDYDENVECGHYQFYTVLV